MRPCHKKLLFIFAAIIAGASCYSQLRKNIDTTYTEPGHLLTLTYTTNGLRDSTVYTKYKDGGKAIFIYKGNSGGTWIFYSLGDSNKLRQFNVENNLTTGPAYYYYKNGNVRLKENFENNLREGKVTSYYENGTILWESSYKKNKINGASIHYYKNGKLQWKGMYKAGKMKGERLCYYENGSLWNGPFVLYHENGLKEKEGMALNGKPEGELKQYNSKAELVKTVNFKNGKPDGPTNFYKDGKIISTDYYKNGKFKKEVTAEPGK